MSWLPRHTLARAGEAARLWQDGTTINTGRFVAPCGSQDSVGRNALSDHCSRNLSDEIAVRIIEIQRERTAVGVTLFAKNKRFGQITRSRKISAYIVEPNSVSKLESPRRRLLPRPEADVSFPGIDVRVVNFGAASIPDLERLLDLLIPNQEADMPKSNDRHVDRTITRGGRSALNGRWWHLRLVSDGSRSGGHRSERSTALGHCGR